MQTNQKKKIKCKACNHSQQRWMALRILALCKQYSGRMALWTELVFSSRVNYPVLHAIMHY